MTEEAAVPIYRQDHAEAVWRGVWRRADRCGSGCCPEHRATDRRGRSAGYPGRGGCWRGNFFRGAELSQRGMDRDRADYMAMLGTVMNTLALQDFLEKQGIPTRVQTAITMGQVAEPYIPRRAERHLEKGRVVIFAAGWACRTSLRTRQAPSARWRSVVEVLLMGKSGVDGVYDADPRTHPDAVRFDTISYDDVLLRGLEVADATAFSLCRDNGMPIIVFDLADGNIARVVRGEKIGTLVSATG